MRRNTRLHFFGWAAVLMLGLTGVEQPESHLTICRLQGSGFTARYEGLPVRTEGVVTLDLDDTGEKGFFMQAEACDDDPLTSDGIFVYLRERADVVSVGDRVVVRGWVNEFYGLTEIGSEPQKVEILGTASLPAAVRFDPPADEAAAAVYFEAHESMRIATGDVQVVGPTTARGEAYVLSSGWGAARVMHGADAGAIIPVGSAGPYGITPEVRVGDRVSGLEGVLGMREGEFMLQLTAPPVVTSVVTGPDPLPESALDLSFATLNLHNLFDTFNDPATLDQVPSSTAYRRKLEKLARVIAGDLELPLLIFLQEAENDDVLQALANRPELPVRYDFVWADGPDVRGIDVALFYRVDRVEILSWESRQGCTSLVDGLGPDGNLDVLMPENAPVCDLDGVPDQKGNRLFSRPPLVIRLAICQSACAPGVERTPYTVISFHLKSKSQDTALVAHTEARRIEQAAFLAGLYREVVDSDPGARVILAGDFNDYPDSDAARQVVRAGLTSLMEGSRYTYVFHGISQVLDQVFVSPAAFQTKETFLAAFPRHIAADYPAGLEADASVSLRASDHDPVLVFPVAVKQELNFPLIFSP